MKGRCVHPADRIRSCGRKRVSPKCKELGCVHFRDEEASENCPENWREIAENCLGCQSKPVVVFADEDKTGLCQKHWNAWGPQIHFTGKKFTVKHRAK